MHRSKEEAFNEIVRRVRRECFGKGPDRIKTYFVENMAITVMHGNLTPTEKFISQTPEGAEMVRSARTKMIQERYARQVPEGMEELVGSKLLYLFSDFKVHEDMGVSVFIFEKPIQTDGGHGGAYRGHGSGSSTKSSPSHS